MFQDIPKCKPVNDNFACSQVAFPLCSNDTVDVGFAISFEFVLSEDASDVEDYVSDDHGVH